MKDCAPPARMKVALDATPLTVATGGIRRYTEELQRALTTAFPGDGFILPASRPMSSAGGPPDFRWN